MKRSWTLCCFLLCVMAVALAQTPVEAMFPNTILTRNQYEKVKSDLAKGENDRFPGNWYARHIQTPAAKIVDNDRKTTPVESTQQNPDKVSIKEEMEAIRQLCLAYLFSQEEKYLHKAVEYLKAWAGINVAISRQNIQEEVYNTGVEGYSLIRRVMAPADRELIDGWLRKRVDVFIKDNDLRDNNWGTCLLHQYYLYGTVLEDESIINRFSSVYTSWAKKNLFPNGTTTDLLGRDAFAYHAYDLLFFARLCHLKIINEGVEAAEAFYAQDIHWGASIQNSVNFWKPFLTDPQKYTHLEFVETEYAPDKNRSDYNKPYTPSGTLYVVDELYEIDPTLKPVLEQYKRTPESTLKAGLSHLRWYYEE